MSEPGSEPAAFVRCQGDGMEDCCLPPDIPVPLRRREPKFVPYEPYKAAVTPMVPTGKSHRTRLATLEIPFPLQQVSSSSSSSGVDGPLLAVVREVPEGATPSTSAAEEEVRLEQQLCQERQRSQDLQEQLRVQVEVNRELKKLLVASLGEDMEARVHFLSEDKAQLAADVRAYAHRLSQGREELDRLAIHADVWRSKFLAASLLVDELASCKARLTHQCDDFQEALQWMASEHQQLEANLTATCRLLAKLQELLTAGATAASPGKLTGQAEPCDVLQLSAQAQRAARSCCHQAVPRGSSANLRLGPAPIVRPTPAETFARVTERAYEALKHSFSTTEQSVLQSSISSGNKCSTNGMRKTHDCSTIACCRHCSGHLENI